MVLGLHAGATALADPAAESVGLRSRIGTDTHLMLVDLRPKRLTGKVAEQLALPDPMPKLVMPDFAVTTKIQPEIADWWKKSIQHS